MKPPDSFIHYNKTVRRAFFMSSKTKIVVLRMKEIIYILQSSLALESYSSLCF